jgi:hypothetical protein
VLGVRVRAVDLESQGCEKVAEIKGDFRRRPGK